MTHTHTHTSFHSIPLPSSYSLLTHHSKTMAKLLAEFLREQQEPFSLDLYLLERGYYRGNEASPHQDHHHHHHHHFSKGSSVFSLRKRHCAATSFSGVVKAAFGKLALHRDSGKGQKRFSCTKVFNSCSERDKEDAHCHDLKNEEVDAGLKPRGSSMEMEEYSDKQLSPVSVLEETKSDEGSPLHHKHYSFKAAQCESSTSQRKSSKQLHQSSSSTTVSELQEQAGVVLDPHLQYLTNKRLLQQTKRLLVDCVREILEDQRRRDKNREQPKQILDADELWKLVCENVRIWSKGNSSSVIHLLHSDFLDSLEEWKGDYEHKKEEIAVKIGDDILEDVIKEIAVGLG